MEETPLTEALRKAESFPDVTPPNNAVEVGRVDKPGITFIVFKDEQNNYYYDSVQGLEFKRAMQKAQKKRR